MSNKENELTNSDTTIYSDTPPDNALQSKKTFFTPKRIETIVAILLGVTTLLSAWASWIAHLHGGLQSIHFTESNNTASQGTAAYNIGTQAYIADLMAWNNLRDYNYELEKAKADGDQSEVDLINDRIKTFKEQNISDTLAKGIKWMEENNEDNPFLMPDMEKEYFAAAQQTVDDSQELLEEGKRDNTKGDSYQLVTVIYSLTLFLLGIVNTFKSMPNKITVLCIAFAFLVFAFIYMCTIPMPTGFENMNFFEFNK